MGPLKSAVGAFALILAGTVVSAESPELCGRNAQELKTLFVSGRQAAAAGPSAACAAVSALQKGRPTGDTDEAFGERWKKAAAGLQLAGAQEPAARALYQARWMGAARGDRPRAPPSEERERALSAAGFGRASQITASMAGALGRMKEEGGALGGGQDRAMATPKALNAAMAESAASSIANPMLFASMGPVLAAQLARPAASKAAVVGQRSIGAAAALNAAAAAQGLKAEEPAGRGLRIPEVPAAPVDEALHAMGNVRVAPAPSAGLRAVSLWNWGAAKTVQEDIRTVRAAAGELQLPPEAATGLASSQAPLGDFVNWVKNAKDSDLPSIEYGILKQGEIGRYKRALLGGKGSITLNIAIRNAEPKARAAVLFHELFHYWDKEVARLAYGNVSYGYIDKNHLPEHEYDAYYLTAMMWQQAKPAGAASPLAQFLEGLPQDRNAVTSFIEGNLKAIKE